MKRTGLIWGGGLSFLLVVLVTMHRERHAKDDRETKGRHGTYTALVTQYVPGASIDSYEDGTVVAHDATILTIISPTNQRGRMVVYHGIPPTDRSPWRAVGAMIRFEMLEELVDWGDQLFSDSVTQISILQQGREGG